MIVGRRSGIGTDVTDNTRSTLVGAGDIAVVEAVLDVDDALDPADDTAGLVIASDNRTVVGAVFESEDDVFGGCDLFAGAETSRDTARDAVAGLNVAVVHAAGDGGGKVDETADTAGPVMTVDLALVGAVLYCDVDRIVVEVGARHDTCRGIAVTAVGSLCDSDVALVDTPVNNAGSSIYLAHDARNAVVNGAAGVGDLALVGASRNGGSITVQKSNDAGSMAL